ncbi:MAG: hypothetical protein JXL81_02895 [Deltaproteobacteria bacterium]|nr:hypothetical protein [Deltaproteobacteria bacterium]
MTTEDKLLAQDDIDALLGEAGIEGDYDSKKEIDAPKRSLKSSIVKFSNVTDDEVHETISLLLAKALLERDDDVKVIWNAGGTIPMGAGLCMNIQNMEFESLGVLKDNHLVVKQKCIE